jgi:hypothetical protein
MSKKLVTVRNLLNHFKIDGKPAGEITSPGEVEIVEAIYFKENPRIACLAPTGYGKSDSISMGVILNAILKRENYIIASVKYGTANIIMSKVIEHIFDDDIFVSQLMVDKGQDLATLKQRRNKSYITFKFGGSIRIVSLHGSDTDVSNVMGEHVPNVILDESPLLTPTKYLLVLKMLEGTGDYKNTFLFELGNAINRNHFMFNVKENSEYLKIDISLEQAIAEGRLDVKSVEEKRGMPNFEEFYLCRFPEEDEIDEKGYKQLLTTQDIDNITVGEIDLTDEMQKLGVDVAGGGDYNVYCIRQNHGAWIEGSNKSNDTMTNVTEIMEKIENSEVTIIEEGKSDEKKKLLTVDEVYLDDIGIGRGVGDRLFEKGMNVNAVTVGEKAQESDRYANKKAEYYWRVRQWILAKDADGNLINKLQAHNEKGANVWHQLTWIKYKTDTDKVIQIEPKDDMKARTGKSCDFAEAFMLTFSEPVGQPDFRLL